MHALVIILDQPPGIGEVVRVHELGLGRVVTLAQPIDLKRLEWIAALADQDHAESYWLSREDFCAFPCEDEVNLGEIFDRLVAVDGPSGNQRLKVLEGCIEIASLTHLIMDLDCTGGDNEHLWRMLFSLLAFLPTE